MRCKRSKYVKASIGIILLSILISILIYPSMPETMAFHWNASNQIDGYTPKAYALAAMPIISILLLGFFFIIPSIDPLKKNIKKFRKYFDMLILIMTAFLFYIHLLTIGLNFGIGIDMSQGLSPGLGLLFYFLGIILENSKRNWFIGIRTPWTLTGDRVWSKTNKFGGKLMKIAGIIAVFGIVFPDLSFILIIGPVIAFTVLSTIYSYLVFKKRI